MIRLSQYKSKLRSCWRQLALVIFAIIAFCTAVIGSEVNTKEQIAERNIFIEKAMKDQDEKIKEQVAELEKRHLYPMMMVTTLVPFADWDYYFVKDGNVRWKPNAGQTFQEVVVPEGFVTDLASIPQIFWQVIRPEGRYAFAAVVHDYLYWTQTRPREEADRIFKLAMEDSKVNPATIKLVYEGVRTFGQAAWDNNAKLKKAGERRVLKRFPKDFTTSWSDWKQQPNAFKEVE